WTTDYTFSFFQTMSAQINSTFIQSALSQTQ
ncbi:MAG: hypothetical protein ACI943_001595, partial [Gammaproteobacteria bacterium]